jgi:hypothetical protein
MIIDLNPAEPARIGWRLPRGVKWREEFFFHRPGGAVADMTNTYPQLVLRPRSRGGALGYDLDMSNPVGGYGTVDIDGGAINDPHGYLAELYSRDSSGTPNGLLGRGEIAISGGAYEYSGPFSPLTLPIVAGPPGAAGEPGRDSTVPGPAGQRGSLWFSGSGAPSTIPGAQDNDHYLDTSTGDVWVYSSASGWRRFVPL